ncbi:DNA polymerase delta subunit 4, partial [Lecanoromycetidae sp. Uapishka_2]
MPPSRRKPSNPTTRTQNTLSFGPNSNKITKPTSSLASKKASKSLEKAVTTEVSTPPPAPEDVAEITPESPSRDLPIRKQGGEKQAEGTPQEQKAAKVSETQIRKYWKGKEDERIAPRVHQQGLSVDEKILRHFDLSSQYGPCIGIPRMKRWKRADGLGLKPPIEVLAVLIKEEKGGNSKAERAFMDGLLTSRLAVNE